MAKMRNSNFEILRIISIVFIIFMHCTLFGFNLYDSKFGLNKVALEMFFAGGKIGVNCFILITGYFMIKSNISVRKMFKLISQILFYSILFTIIGVLFLNTKFNFGLIFPIIHGSYWFVTCYVVLYLLIPFLNKFLLSFGQEWHKKILILLLILWCIIPTVFWGAYVGYSDVGWFVVLYLIGVYIRLYLPSEYKYGFIKYFFKFATYFAICIVLTVGIDFFAIKNEFFRGLSPYLSSSYLRPYFVHFLNMNSAFLLMASIYLFLAFKYLYINSYKLINLVSSTTFGIYLIHEHGAFKYLIWQDIFKNETYATGCTYLIGSVFAEVFLVFTVCCIIDILRQKLLEGRWMSFYDKIYPKLKNKFLNSKFYDLFNRYIDSTILHKKY